MEHLKSLPQPQLDAIRKFQEYGATIVIGFGNKATYPDLVYTNAYSDEIINKQMATLRAKDNVIQQALDAEDAVDDTEFYIPTPHGRVVFSVSECLEFLRGVKGVRKYYKNLQEIAQVEGQLALIAQKKLTPAERLLSKENELLAKLNALKGTKADAPVATPVVANAEG